MPKPKKDVKRPNLTEAKLLAVDIETKDTQLKELGSGAWRKDGAIMGVALSDGTFGEYYALNHYNTSQEERDANWSYVTEQLAANNDKLGTNLYYDADWLQAKGAPINGTLYDISIAEPLIDENQGSYSLDFQAQKYLNVPKAKSEIEAWCERNNLKGDPRQHIYRMPDYVVRDYAIGDVLYPHQIHALQMKQIEARELSGVYDLERRLLRCLLMMRQVGTRIDPAIRDWNALQAQNKLEEERIAFEEKYGVINVKSGKQIGELLDGLKLTYPKTATGNPNIDADFLESVLDEHEVFKYIYTIRKFRTTLDNFMTGSLVRYFDEDSGLIRCAFHSLRTDIYGTRSGRFSSSNPNFQQMPSVDMHEFLGSAARRPFVPYVENAWWGKIDYSQIEYRVMAHYAVGPGADEVRQRYNDNPDIDFHAYIMQLTSLIRTLAKRLNFGVAFGMGARGMVKKFGYELDYAKELLALYHRRAPFIRATIDLVERVAKRRGYIKTLAGRQAHLADPSKAYVMYNRLVQGSAADLMKMAMVNCYEAGLFDTLYLHLTVHDELDVTVPKTNAGVEAFAEMKHRMENCVQLKVPIKAEAQIGPNWADVKDFEFKELLSEVA